MKANPFRRALNWLAGVSEAAEAGDAERSMSEAQKVEARSEDARIWFDTSPEKFYPKALQELEQDIKSGNRLTGFDHIYARAIAAYVNGGFEWASTHKERTPKEKWYWREEALESARLYATKKLHEEAGGSIGLRIHKTKAGEKFKL